MKVAANVVYVASYYTSSGIYAATGQGLRSAISNGSSLTTLSSDRGASGVFTYNAPGFPTNSYNATNYWVDVLFATGPYDFKLTGVTDSNGCSVSGDLQTLTVSSSPCEQQQRSAVSVQASQPAPAPVETKSQPEENFSNDLRQNYPNPFNSETTITFTLAKAGKVNLSLYDLSGRLVRVLVNENREAGTHSVRVNGGILKKGLYMYRLQTGNYSAVKKMVMQ